MFKTDSKSLEELSFSFTEQDINRLRSLLDLIKVKNISTLTLEDFQRVYDGLTFIEALKLEGKVYAFKVEDTYAAKQGGDSGEGVELYIRRGSTLKEFTVCSHRDWVFKIDQVVPILNKAKINTVYTGRIEREFLGLPEVSDPDDPIYRGKLENWEIDEFYDEGINVISLDSLV